VESKLQKVISLGLEQIATVIYSLDGPLGEGTYSGLTQKDVKTVKSEVHFL
jgi:hypothetical protein